MRKKVDTVHGYIYPFIIGNSFSFAPIAIIKGLVNKNIILATIMYTKILRRIIWEKHLF